MNKTFTGSDDVRKIKAAVAINPLLFLHTLYGHSVTQVGETWRIGSKGGRCFDTRKGELLCVTFNGDAGQGDCITVWRSHYKCDFRTALAEIGKLYGIGAGVHPCAEISIERPAIPNTKVRLTESPKVWSRLDGRNRKLWDASYRNLMVNPEAQAIISNWRGWPLPMVQRIAMGQIIGLTDFNCWPSSIAPQPAVFFRVLQPELRTDDKGAAFWCWEHVQCHIRFLRDATWLNKRPLSWIYFPTMREIAVSDGANAPLVLAQSGLDPEQPRNGTKCECIIICAGEWDAITIVVAMEWIDSNGILTIPKGLAIVGIRGEGRGGTDAFLRWYNHWRPSTAILLADADATGNSWFRSTDGRPCFAELLEARGMKVLPKAPKPREGIKDVSDIYRAGLLHHSHIEALLVEGGFSMEGDSK